MPKPVGKFKNSRGQEIVIFPRKNESSKQAIARVTKKHGAQISQVKPA